MKQFMLSAALLLLCGCTMKPVAPTTTATAVELDQQRTQLFIAQHLRKGWTITNWNREEIWVAPNVAFKPRTPLMPTFTKMKAFLDGHDPEDSVTNFQPTVRVINYTNEFQNVVVMDELGKPISGWMQDTNVYSPNFIWVMDSSFGPPPGNAKFITTQQ